jgi:hypothetical protein
VNGADQAAEYTATAETRALDEAWRDILDTREGEALADRPIVALLFAAVVGGPYDGAELDAPSVAVLRAIRATARGWACMVGDSTRCASVPFAEVDLLVRRLDVAIEIVRRTPAPVPAAVAGGAP